MLSPKKGLLHPKFKAVEVVDEVGDDGTAREQTVVVDPENFYEGRYDGGNVKVMKP